MEDACQHLMHVLFVTLIGQLGEFRLLPIRIPQHFAALACLSEFAQAPLRLRTHRLIGAEKVLDEDGNGPGPGVLNPFRRTIARC